MNFGQIYSVHLPNERAFRAWSQKMRAFLDPKRQFDVIEVESLPVEDIAALTGLSGEILRGISKLLAHRHILKEGIANVGNRISIFDAESAYTNTFAEHAKRLVDLPPDFDAMFWNSPDPHDPYDAKFVQLRLVDDLPSYVINKPFMQTLLNHIESRAWVAFSPYVSDMINNLISTNGALVLGPHQRCIIPPPRAWRHAFNEINTALTQPIKLTLLQAADQHFNDT